MLAQSIMAYNHSANRTGATTRDVTKLTPSHYVGFRTTDGMRGVTRYTDRLQVSSADMLHGRQS